MPPYRHPERRWALLHQGVVAVVPIPSPGDRQWPGAYGGHLACTMPPLLLAVLLLLSLSLPCLAVLPHCVLGQGTDTPQPFPCWGPALQLLLLIRLVGDSTCCLAGFASLVERVDTEMQEERTGQD